MAAGHRAAAARAHALASLSQRSGSHFIGGLAGAVGGNMGGSKVGRGRGRGRAKLYYGPDEFDDSWWQPPPPIGPDPYLQGYSQHVYPRNSYGYGGMPYGGYGTGNHFWGGPSYKYPMNMPWWRGRAYSPRSGREAGHRGDWQTPKDSFGGGTLGGGAFPMASPYYYSPPPLQGDWNLPKNPPPPPGGAGGEGGE